MVTDITPEMKKAIERSGYLLEAEVAEIVRQQGYFVIPNHAFRDPESGENREIDIFAISAEVIKRKEEDFIFPILLIECKNIQSPLVFFSREEVPSRYIVGDLQISGIPKEIKTKDGFDEDLAEYLKLEKICHYYRAGNISTQFCAIVSKKDKKDKDFIATHKIDSPLGNLYESMILPVIKALHYEKEEHENSYYPDPQNETINLQLYYPIVVINGSLFECLLKESGEPTYKSVQRVNFLRRYQSTEISGDYRIDIVAKESLGELLGEIDKEIEMITKRIKQGRDELIENAKRIAKERLKEEKHKKH
ncbi:MAG: hypothetical protein COY46_04400 [Chloroflexi bacterium CG_4_10_14_0_8_um_filter_46_9]|nr:MAG: hypothetical protein COY46_04400 [Chloroflexi bacterium CG_4_10_14_0_8_um_filter_46_9]